MTLSLLGLVQACSATPYPPRFIAARRAEEQGDLERARENYEAVFQGARRKKDRIEAGMRLAALLLRMGKVRDSVRTYLAVETGPGRGSTQGARALFRAGRILADRLHDSPRAERIWRRTIRDYPDSLAAGDSLSRLLGLYRDRYEPRRLLEFLNNLARAVQSGRLQHYAYWAAAGICRRQLHDHACAFQYCTATWKAAPRSALADDALICAAREAKALGKPRQAQIWYRRLLGTREEAVLVGSYHSEWLDDAQFELGRLYLEDLHEPKRAVRAFRRLIRTYPSSILRDDAQWWVCLTRLRQGRKDRALACWKRLAHRFPESRFVRERAALGDWAPVAEALRSGNDAQVCAALAAHAKAHPFGWFRRRRRELAKRFKCPSNP